MTPTTLSNGLAGAVLGAVRREQGADEGLSDELAVALSGPPAAEYEQFVEFGRAKSPLDVGGILNRDPRPKVTGPGQAMRGDGHTLKPGSAELIHDVGDLGVARGSVPGQQEHRHDARAEFGGERAPGSHDPAGIGLSLADVVGSLLGGDRALSGEALLDDGPHQAGLAAEALVD